LRIFVLDDKLQENLDLMSDDGSRTTIVWTECFWR